MVCADAGIVKRRSYSIIFAAVILSGCSGGNGGGGDEDADDGQGAGTGGNASSVGYFVDEAVSNISYVANGISGATNGTGRFVFNVGEPVTFSYAGLELGSVTLSETATIITPAELRGETRDAESYSRSTRNLLRLLQTLDRDGDPTNGIELPSPQELTDNGLTNALAGQQLDEPNLDTQIASALADFNAAFGTPTALVDEDEALAHFERTLKGLNFPDDVLFGQFDIHTQGFGQYAGRIIFNDSVSGTYEEWRDCSDEGERNWIGTRERAQQLCNTLSAESITVEINGATFTFTNGEITDTCTILSGNVHKFTATCDIDLGNDGRQIEIQYFVRSGIDRFTDPFMVGEFAEFTSGGHKIGENSTLRFREDSTGDYEILKDPIERGDYTWSLSSNGNELLLDLDDETGPFEPIEYMGYYAGSFHTLDGESQEERVMIPDYNASRILARGERVGVSRYSLIDGTPLWSGDFPSSTIQSDTDPGNTGEIFVDDPEAGVEQTCRILHSISPVQGGRVLWADCTDTNVPDATSAERSFELLRVN